MRQLILILVTIVATCGQAFSTALGDLASSMKSGEWKELQTIGFTANLLEMGAYDCIFLYCDHWSWDPVSRQVLFVGNPHDPYTATGKFISYSEATNIWKEEAKNFDVFWHAYHHNAINEERREFYHRHNNNVFRYNIDSKSWGQLPNLPNGEVCCGALEWFPDLGRLVFIGGTGSNGSIALFNYASNQWRLHSYKPVLGTYQFYAGYNPVHKVILFGGGNGCSALYKMDASGNVVRLKDSPVGPIGPSMSTVTVDPVSGKYLVLMPGLAFHEYDIMTDTWQQLSAAPSFSRNGPGHLPATPVSTYGVTLWGGYNFNTNKVYVYKHASGTAAEARGGAVKGERTLTAFPNPFRSTVRLDVGCANARLRIYDGCGRLVKKLFTGPDATLGAVWDASGASPGAYVVVYSAGGRRMEKVIILVK